MKQSPLLKIKEYSQYLPAKDIKYADKFIASRDFERLKELVDSALIKVKRSQSSSNPKEEYIDIDIEKLEELKSEVYSYLILLGVPEDEVYGNGEEDDNENILEEECYYLENGWL